MTMQSGDNGPIFLDVIGCFSTLKRAKEIIDMIESGMKIPGLDYDTLQPCDGVAMVGSFEINKTVRKTKHELG
jgi:hypothetical protein